MSPNSSSPSDPGAPPSENLLAAIIDSSDDAIISKSLDGIVTSWNRGAERMFGYGRDEMVGKPMVLLVPEERAGEDGDMLKRIKAGEKIDHFETVRRARDGRLVDISVTISPVRDSAGKIVGASTVARDITEQKRGDRADLLLAAIVSSSEDAIISKTLEGIITSWNDSAGRMFGYAAGEIIGQPVLRLIPPDRQDEEPRILERLRRGDRVDHFETVRVRKNGEHFPVSLTISPVRDSAGKIVGASKIARDITQLKRITLEREQLLESERAARAVAETASRMKDNFLSTVSHELRTPLNAIVGWTDVLAGGGTDRDEVIHGIDVIKRNAMMQAQLIEDLLDLGRISAGKMTLDIAPVSVRQVIFEAMNSVEHSARAKHISIKVIMGDVRGLLGDSKRLQQVIWNLLTNAIKFTPTHGKIVVSASRVGSHVEISVVDSGKGISADFLPHIFERFSQADSSTTRVHGGLGIGLALVKQLVELHGGSVQAQSGGENQGATFTVLLPIAALHPALSSQATSKEGPGPGILPDLQGIRVLAVDDDRDSLEVLKRILTARQAEVQTASSVDEAMNLLENFEPDVLLSDIGMPGQGGYDLIRKIRERPNGSALPAAALTALARSDDRTRILTAGFQSHIAKPVATAELIATVKSLASMRPRPAPNTPSG
jgi:PAS domain S-box-containing protein